MRLRVIAPVFAAAALLAACDGFTTAAGPLAPPADCRARLKAEVRALAPADAEASRAQVRVTIGNPPSHILVKWRYFKIGNAGYILSYDATLENSVAGARVEFRPYDVITLVGTDGEPNDFLTVEVRRRRGFTHNVRTFQIDGYGLSSCIDPD